MVGEVKLAAVGAIAALIIIPVALVIGGWQLQQGRNARKAAEDAAARAEEAALSSVTWRLKADLWVPVRNTAPYDHQSNWDHRG